MSVISTFAFIFVTNMLYNIYTVECTIRHLFKYFLCQWVTCECERLFFIDIPYYVLHTKFPLFVTGISAELHDFLKVST